MNDWIAPWLHSIRVPYENFGDAIVKALESEDGIQVLLPHQWMPVGNLL
jgi:LacI family transcriptional regulator